MNIVGSLVDLGVDVDIVKNGGGTYKGTRITYRDTTGSLKEQCIHTKALNFNPTLKAQITALKMGDGFTMVKEKEGEFWNVKSITVGIAQETNKSSNTSTGKVGGVAASPRSTYETPEERAKKQVFIIKQSSISSAIAFIGATTKKGTVTDVLDIAKHFESYVLGQDFDDGSIEMLSSDDID